MYSKEEAYQIKKKFWTAFGQYMKLQTSASGEKVNWVNYKTGIKDLYFRTDFDNKTARIAIEMSQKDVEIQALMYAQFEEFQPLFEQTVGGWIWFPVYYDWSGKQMAKIELKLENVNVFKEDTWSESINFLKDNLLRLDEFWFDVKDSFDLFK